MGLSGHLARRKSDGRLILREVAQTTEEDEAAFQDISKHSFFNTNNLWIRLDKLAELMDAKVQAATSPPILSSFCRHLLPPPRPGRALAGAFARSGGRDGHRRMLTASACCAGPRGPAREVVANRPFDPP
jgi:hypothetical protein